MKNRTSTETLNDDIKNINLWTLISLATIVIITVILLGIYYKNFHSLGWGDTAAFGTFGDYIGGLLNPLVAFLALIALWRTSSVQTKFLHDQLKKEDRNAQKIETKETEAIQRELFFRSYDAYLLTLEQMIYYPPCPSCGQREAKWDHAPLNAIDQIHPKILFPKLFK
ncbi:MAG: hypothetical protein KGO49_03330 [Gammaproteobacteria bacterium]|nr:hypothetical protein [Gammaproteobacteria bacterium]